MRLLKLDQFYEHYHQDLLEDNGRRSLRPTKSYTKDIIACFDKFKELYLKEGIVPHTKDELSSILNVDTNTTLQNMRSMQEFGFLSGSLESPSDENDLEADEDASHDTYTITSSFAQLSDSDLCFGSFLYERLGAIRSLEDFTPYLNLLVCTLREAAKFGNSISFGPIGYDKYKNIVTNDEDRQTLRNRIFEIYGYFGRRAPGQSVKSDNYLPNISYMSLGTLEDLGLLKKDKDKNEYGLTTYSLTYPGICILRQIEGNIRSNYHSTFMHGNFIQKIYFGTPGSGKSHTVKKFVDEDGGKIFRTTFHPDSDYGTFVGSYKPVKTDEGLTYEFVPQAFTDAYVWAWKYPKENVYLVIEEINRGNCAQIFGDLFQLLDRTEDGLSEYPVKADKDLCKYLMGKEVLGIDHEGIANGDLKLPSNFNILATMNTSDQSLFPMDSAFKRRWAWEYVPINEECSESQFKITIGDQVYKWASFLKEVNKHIHKLSDSEDKQMGNFFIKSDVNVEVFKSKVMFYLWSEVCKEYEKAGSFFKYRDETNNEVEFTFNTLYPTSDKTNRILQKFMSYLGVEIDEEATKKETKATVFVNKLVEIGLDKIIPLNISVNDYPLIGTSQPHGHAFRRIEEYYVQTAIDDKDGMIADILSKLE